MNIKGLGTIDLRAGWETNKKWILLVLVALLLLAGGYGAGRLTTPSKVVEKEKVVEHVVEKVVYQDKVVVQKVYVQVEKKKEHTETTTTKKPDGEVVTTTKTDTDTDDTTKDDETKTEDKVVYRDRVVDRVVEKLKLVESKKLDWRVGAGVGVAIPTLLGQPELGVPGLRGFVIQAEVNRRIIGPVWLGVFGNTQGTAGLSLSGVF